MKVLQRSATSGAIEEADLLGATGADGADGAAGPQGPAGADGATTFFGNIDGGGPDAIYGGGIILDAGEI